MTRRLYQGLFLTVLLICTVLFAKEIKNVSQIMPHFDKVVHFTVFFVLSAIMHRAFKAPIWIHLLLLACYGAGVEIMQHYLPHRQASIADFIADFMGGIIYFSGYWLWQKKTVNKMVNHV